MPKKSPTKRNMLRIYNKTVLRWHSYVIDFYAGWSFGEVQLNLSQFQPLAKVGVVGIYVICNYAGK